MDTYHSPPSVELTVLAGTWQGHYRMLLLLCRVTVPACHALGVQQHGLAKSSGSTQSFLLGEWTALTTNTMWGFVTVSCVVT